MLRAFLAAIAAFLLFLGLLFYVVLTASFGQAADGGLSGAPTQEALDDIPPRYLALYQKAATSQSCHVPWAVLAGIGKVESDHGRLGAPGVKAGTTRGEQQAPCSLVRFLARPRETPGPPME